MIPRVYSCKSTSMQKMASKLIHSNNSSKFQMHKWILYMTTIYTVAERQQKQRCCWNFKFHCNSIATSLRDYLNAWPADPYLIFWKRGFHQLRSRNHKKLRRIDAYLSSLTSIYCARRVSDLRLLWIPYGTPPIWLSAIFIGCVHKKS